MRRFAAIVLSLALCSFAFFACSSETTYQDGTYRAEYASYDAFGYKSFLVVTVQGGNVTAMEFDSLDEAGELKSQNEEYRAEMEAIQGTYPEKYSADLINQYMGMEVKDIDKVDDVAGATEASQSFKALFKALVPSMEQGNTTTIII